MEEFPLEAASELELLGVEEAASEEEEEGSEEAYSEEASEEVSELEEVSSGYMALNHQGDCLNDCAPLEIHQLWLHHDDLAILDSLQLRKGFIVRKLLLDLGRAENIIRITGGQSAELHLSVLGGAGYVYRPGELHELTGKGIAGNNRAGGVIQIAGGDRSITGRNQAVDIV